MSCILEAVVAPLGVEVDRIPGFRQVPNEWATALLRDADRSEPIDEELVNGAARDLSLRSAVAVSLFHNDQTAARWCSVFRVGSLQSSFDSRSEVWVLLDEDGKAIENGKKYLVHEIPPDKEAECYMSALQQGLDFVGLTRQRAKEVLVYLLREA